ncbi:hypothetical protein SCOCK_620002 [Actinacidiphila cocklensis]|uniref:Uncharacterized protein n=1 Tax=Actinacidiphila cocklensis TaxID=887465 RepID=A0A9W4E2N7_9ACTN|nr:hypothetical protein SCOCK_620002 [Actinacidiphila cocklensis]
MLPFDSHTSGGLLGPAWRECLPTCRRLARCAGWNHIRLAGADMAGKQEGGVAERRAGRMPETARACPAVRDTGNAGRPGRIYHRSGQREGKRGRVRGDTRLSRAIGEPQVFPARGYDQ